MTPLTEAPPTTIVVAQGGSAKSGWTNDLTTIRSTPRGHSSQRNQNPFLGFRTSLSCHQPLK